MQGFLYRHSGKLNSFTFAAKMAQTDQIGNAIMPRGQAAVFMQHAIELAGRGAGTVAPNPMVGAVLVANGRIIGQGFHQQFGGPHAEIVCLDSVKAEDRLLIPQADMFVTLEPCSHFGKTAPCADRIIREKIPRVWIAARDPFPAVDGRGIEKLQQAGIWVDLGLEAEAARLMNRRFFHFYEKKRPYIILKWAETADGFMAGTDPAHRLLISNEFTRRLVHRWRSEEAAIMVATNTALLDQPQLNNRYWPGSQPIRILLDRHLKVPANQPIFSGGTRTLIYNEKKDDVVDNNELVRIPFGDRDLTPLLQNLFERRVMSVLVEGGTQLLHSFLQQNYWDEARIIRNTEMRIGHGLQAPAIVAIPPGYSEHIGNDLVSYYFNPLLQSTT
ncbi:MAG: bifunctional diaminohydroxyphosphoribosylaminopyrimidine deaminase/5-amino-6-(5-phosphoribosylamino)uracil reductase RibD [Chitinophagaceae bacterium]